MRNQSTIDNIVAQLDVYPKTESNKIILSRLLKLKNNNDNYYVDNIVNYHSNCLARFYLYSSNNVKGKPISDNMSDLLAFIINSILDNSEECQFSLKGIIQKFQDEHRPVDIPRLHRIEYLLIEHFHDEIVIHATRNDRFICFKRTMGQRIEDSWYSKRKSNEGEERERLVELAAHIILQDIREVKFNIDSYYNSPSDFLNNVTDEIPKTLKIFLDILIKTHKRVPMNGSSKKWDNKIVTATHILMSSVRPRSFNSSILLGLSCMMHTRFAARGLIDCLYSIGLCASYSETVRFESSVVNDPEKIDIISDTYLQFSYDNADHNTSTIDGKNTFHCMGGIMCVTPSSSIELAKRIPRLKGVLSTASSSSTSGFLPLSDFRSTKPFKLNNIMVNDWTGINLAQFSIKISPSDLLYFFGKHTAPKNTANWHGFKNTCHNFNTDYFTTRVIALPFIKAPPSDHTTIMTALIDARLKANKNNQKHCFVTFDLPLFMKGNEVLASIDADNDPHNLLSVILRLGGFHLCMSFIGSIDNITAGNGLKEAFCTIYAELSAEKALSGHAFSRAVRGHILVQAALATSIFNKIELTEDDKKYLNEGLRKVGDKNLETYLSDEKMLNVQNKFEETVDKLRDNGPTAQLWLQYFKLIMLLLQFIDAERSGNFDKHVQSLILMTPFFSRRGTIYTRRLVSCMFSEC